MKTSQLLLRTSIFCLIVVLGWLKEDLHAGIVLQGFANASVAQSNSLPAVLDFAIDGSGLFPSNTPTYPFDAPINVSSHDEINGSNGWLFESGDDSTSLPIGGVEVELDLGGELYLDAIGLWNSNSGDAYRSALNGYIDSSYDGNAGVETADLYYLDTITQAWVQISLIDNSFAKETSDSSKMQLKEFSPILTSKLKLTLLTNFGSTLGLDGSTTVEWIGFAEVAYRAYIPPSPPVVPEPASLSVFAGLMVVGGVMRWRRLGVMKRYDA